MSSCRDATVAKGCACLHGNFHVLRCSFVVSSETRSKQGLIDTLHDRCKCDSDKHHVFVGVLVQPETKPKENVTEVDGVRILDGRYAMNAEGKVLSPSSQNMAQLKAELTARSLSIEGKRDVLKRRVMVSLLSSACLFGSIGTWKQSTTGRMTTLSQVAWFTM